MPPRPLAVTCHALLVAALAATVAMPALTALRAVLAALLAAPLLALAPGLVRGSARAEQHLAVLLVPYIGGLSVEVVARSGSAPLLNAALLAAVLELGLLVTLVRRRPRSPAARG